MTRPHVATVSFEIDGIAFSFDTWSDTSALWAIRHLARHPHPKRGCEMGLCRSCESLVNGAPTRLCQMPSTALNGLRIVTRLNGAP